MIPISDTGLKVFPLCLGGNVFGWTADEQQSLAVLDAYAAAGGNFVDTADVYSAWAPGNEGGESEAIVGRWMSSRQRRRQTVVATKVGMAPGLQGLSAGTIRAAAEASLRRLRTSYIDIYYAHRDDPRTPLEETLRAFDGLVREGKVLHVAASNYRAPRLAEALALSRRHGLARFVAVQPQLNLLETAEWDGGLASLCAAEGLACVPYYGLARGFLTGKYRPGAEVDSERAHAAGAYLDARGLRVLAALDQVAADRRTPVPAVALAWVAAQPGVAVPIASARTPEQLAHLLPVADLTLSAAEVELLTEAARPAGPAPVASAARPLA